MEIKSYMNRIIHSVVVYCHVPKTPLLFAQLALGFPVHISTPLRPRTSPTTSVLLLFILVSFLSRITHCRGVSCPVVSIFSFTTPRHIIHQRALPAPHLALAQQLCPPRALPTWASDRRQATYYRTDPVILVDSDPSILPTQPLKAASTATSSTNAIG